MQLFFKEWIIKSVDFIPIFILVVRFIFSREKAVKTSHSFTNKLKDCLRVVHIKVKSNQAIPVILAMRKIIKSLQFIEIYNIKVHFSLKFKYN